MHAVLLHMNGVMGMAAENAVRAMLPGIIQRPGRNFWRHAQPPGVQPVNQPYDWLALEVQLLQLQIERRAPLAKTHSVHLKSVKLVTVNRPVAQAAILPGIVLVDTDADQV